MHHFLIVEKNVSLSSVLDSRIFFPGKDCSKIGAAPKSLPRWQYPLV